MRDLRTFVTTTTMLVGWIPSIAAAQTLPRLSYVGDARCPSRDDFAQQLLSRTRALEALTQSQIRVNVAATSDGYLARLDLVDPSGNRAAREFSGPSCSEVTQAIALVAAVTIEGSTVAGPATAATADAPADSAPRIVPAAPKVESPVLEPAKDPADSHTSVVAPNKPEMPTPAREQTLHPFSIGAAAGLHTAIAPYVTPTLGLWVGYHPSGVWGSPRIRLDASIGKSRTKTITFDAASTGEAEFLWLAARTIACPITLVASSMQLGPCAVFEVGALRGSGSSNKGQGSSTGSWVAPGIALDWSAQFDPIALSVTGGIVRPLVREHFKFQPNLEVFRPSSVGLLAEISVAWTF